MLFTSIILFISDFKIKTTKIRLFKILVGVSQTLTIIPGISRWINYMFFVLMGVNRELAAKLSFLMVLPIIFGSFLKI